MEVNGLIVSHGPCPRTRRGFRIQVSNHLSVADDDGLDVGERTLGDIDCEEEKAMHLPVWDGSVPFCDKL